MLKSSVLKADAVKITENAAVYYVSENGDDGNNGTSEASPFKTMAKVNTITADEGQTAFVCFKRGETFRGQLSAQNNVIYTAYGEGEKPILTVSSENGADASKWILMEGSDNIWQYASPLTDVGQIFFNGGATYADKQLSNVRNGAYVTEVADLLTDDLQFFSALDAGSVSEYNNNSADSKGTLYLRCDAGNPGAIYDSIEFAERPYVIFLPTDGKNITIDNLCVKFGGAHGIAGSGITNLTVQNCEIAYIGGGIQMYQETDGVYKPLRYGNGVEINKSCDGYTVNNCWIHDIYDAGVTHQQGSNFSKPLEFANVSYIGNLIENCTYSVEYFARYSSDGKYAVSMKNIIISNNIMRNAGTGFGSDRTDGTYNMSAHIMGWVMSANKAENFVIKNNIFDRSKMDDLSVGSKINSSLILTSAEDIEYLPDFEGNVYIHYTGANFAYYGINNSDFTAKNFVKYSADTNVSEILGDITGKAYLAPN